MTEEMKLSRAIEILRRPSPLVGSPEWHDYFKATQLGIEALERTQSNRKNWAAYVPLPGETMEVK